MRKLCCLLACVAIAMTAVCQADEFKGVTYTKPAGWVDAEEGGAKVFAPKDLKEGELFVVLMTGAAPVTSDTLEKQFEELMTTANDGGKVLKASKTDKHSAGKLTILTNSTELDHKDIGKHSRLYVQISDENQRTFLTVLINKESLVERYGDGFSSLLASIGFKPAASAPPSGPAANTGGSTGKIPTGDTPTHYPGMVGWRPSGQGQPIPAPAIVDGVPQGLWYQLDTPSYGVMKASIQAFMPDGRYASRPRLGGGMLLDYEGQSRAIGENGVGKFSVSDGRITYNSGRFVGRGRLVSGVSEGNPFFKIGEAVHYPLFKIDAGKLAGRWKSGSVEFVFRTDGTYTRSSLLTDGSDAVGQKDDGTYVLDGYLIHLKPANGADWIDLIGFGSKTLMIIGTTTYAKQ